MKRNDLFEKLRYVSLLNGSDIYFTGRSIKCKPSYENDLITVLNIDRFSIFCHQRAHQNVLIKCLLKSNPQHLKRCTSWTLVFKS